MREPQPIPPHMSHSQMGSFMECGERFRLERIFKLPSQRTLYLPAGSAFHSATEAFDFALEKSRMGEPATIEDGQTGVTPAAVLSWFQQLDDTGLLVAENDELFSVENYRDLAKELTQTMKHLAAAVVTQEAQEPGVDDPPAKPGAVCFPLLDLPLTSKVGDLKAKYEELRSKVGDSSELDEYYTSKILPAAARKEEIEAVRAASEEQHTQAVYAWKTAIRNRDTFTAQLWRAALLRQICHQLAEDIAGYDQELRIDPESLVLKPGAQHWKGSGKATATWPEKRTLDWWLVEGTRMLVWYIDWRHTGGWFLAYNEGRPAIELDVTTAIPGLSPIALQGYVDRMFIAPDGQPVLVDIKTGQEPKDHEQLGLYAVLLAILGYQRPKWGAYWLAAENRMSDYFDLDVYDEDWFRYKYGDALDRRNRGVFIANPEAKWCYTCPVSSHCHALQGGKAGDIPKPYGPGGVPIPIAIKTHQYGPKVNEFA